ACPDSFGTPRIDARFLAAARRSDQLLSISLLSTDRRLVSSDQLRPPSPTNKAVNPIRRSSPGVQTHMNRNDRDVLCQNTIASSTSFFCRLQPHFSTVIKSSCQICSKVRLRVGPDSWTRSALWKTRPPQESIQKNFPLNCSLEPGAVFFEAHVAFIIGANSLGGMSSCFCGTMLA